MIKGKQSTIVKRILHISNTRVSSLLLMDEDRINLVADILNIISNAKSGNTIKKYRSNSLTHVNNVKLQTKLAVLSMKNESYKP